jgi:thymidylate synthase ThyX
MLRLAPDAQMEIRQYAQAINDLHKAHTPIANQAIADYVINGMRLSAGEIELINARIADGSFVPGVNLDDVALYTGTPGFTVRKKNGSEGERELGREGQGLRKKLARLLGR